MKFNIQKPEGTNKCTKPVYKSHTCVVYKNINSYNTKNVTYFALNSSPERNGIPESTPFPGLSDIVTTFSSACCSLTREPCSDTRTKGPANDSHSEVKNCPWMAAVHMAKVKGLRYGVRQLCMRIIIFFLK